MEILVSAFKSPSVMSLIAQNNSYTVRSEIMVAELQMSNTILHVCHSDLPKQS